MDQLGATLRAWRDRLDPAAAGLPHHSPRRVPGLRREELAVLAGISAEYVVRLEQGRAPTPSAQVCSALARALRLSDDEQAHLMRLAGHAAAPDRVPRIIPGSLHRIIERLDGHPLAVYDAAWQLLHWNALLAATFGDPTVRGPEARNVLIMHFEGGLNRIRQSPAERAAFEESLVADLRATTSRYPGDPAVTALVARLHRSPRFRELWTRGSVAAHQGASKIVEHPDVGDIALDCDVLTTQGSDLHLVVYTPRPGTDARSKLDLLATIGTQQMTVPR
ncbi:transcriptional regulator with XRE-family HTH domain [Actinoplanes octamycinicus]|uniref:Transcriptional regulator with XRE-family HTH domain n=1 Tax=Actinoplanes octamycinicus TaxID=135948 RepID=A0A7W7M9N4_9ACTN|nr:helix-turn-helix transcriptional regulator [Actinoplanes octamycinicus]MBB4742097.1 transcriptional regulator with XRE-family HTH domain [Actinoplanes octamycinicus]